MCVKIELSPVTVQIYKHTDTHRHMCTHTKQLSFVYSEEILKCVYVLLGNSEYPFYKIFLLDFINDEKILQLSSRSIVTKFIQF